MRFVMFYHSLVSDWNHGNAHFLRGVATELLARGHRVTILEPHDSWSRTNLLAQAGSLAVDRFHRAYPALTSVQYRLDDLDLDQALRLFERGIHVRRRRAPCQRVWRGAGHLAADRGGRRGQRCPACGAAPHRCGGGSVGQRGCGAKLRRYP